jgi:SAM-dependent methyltransferase
MSDTTPRHRFYADLARWWPLVSPVGDYTEEAAEMIRVLRDADPSITTVLELGAGGGHNAWHMKRAFTMTLTDLSPDMLAVSRAINPECEHVCADMRTLDLGRTFDAVFVHDAIHYMATERDLDAAIAIVVRHLRPGGTALIVPDVTTETFEAGTDISGSDGPDGEGVRLLEWTHELRGTIMDVEYAFVIRERDGSVHSFVETHRMGVFPEATWLARLDAGGLAPRIVIEQTTEDRPPRRMLLATR